MIGQLLKGYQVVEKIKDGSVGTVWKVTNSRGQVFALKQISADKAERPEKIRQFKKEAALTQKVRHRSIIQVHEYLDVDPPAFVMEYFESETLKYALWYKPEWVYRHEFKILRQVAEALGFLHDQGIVHKDVKPENVLVNSKAAVRLIDLSLSQSKMDRFLQFGRRVEGTPLYMAPEQIRGEKCDPRADQYSFGVMAYEVLTKRPPFLGTTQQALLEKHLKETPPPLRTWVKTLDPELESVVLKMLSKRKDDRFSSMTEVLMEMSRWERKNTIMRIRQVEPPKPPLK